MHELGPTKSRQETVHLRRKQEQWISRQIRKVFLSDEEEEYKADGPAKVSFILSGIAL